MVGGGGNTKGCKGILGVTVTGVFTLLWRWFQGCVHVSKPTQSYTLTPCGLVCVNYVSIEQFLKMLSPAAAEKLFYEVSATASAQNHGRTAGPQLPSRHSPHIPVGILGPWVKIQETLVQRKDNEDTQRPETQAFQRAIPRAFHPQGGQ